MVGGFFRNNSKKGLTNVSFRAAILLSADSKMALVVRSVFQHTELQGGVFMKPKVIKKALKDTIQANAGIAQLAAGVATAMAV